VKETVVDFPVLFPDPRLAVEIGEKIAERDFPFHNELDINDIAILGYLMPCL